MNKYAVLCLLLLFASCSRLQEFPIEGYFNGIYNPCKCENYKSILVIHGLGGYSAGDPDDLIRAIASKLGVSQTEDAVMRNICKNGKHYGSLLHADYEGGSHHLRIYNLYWHPSTQLPRCCLQAMDQQSDYDTLPMIQHIKETLVDGSLADAILYVSANRKEIQYPFEKTIELITSETNCENIIVAAYSLGSTILIDTLDEMENRAAAERFVYQIEEIFMLSNPTALFELHNWQDGRGCQWQWQDHSIGRFVFEKRKHDPDFQIVAISDPNDALTDIISDYYVPSNGEWKNAFLNEKVRNVKWSLFGLVNPLDAHSNYGENKTVLDMIIFGSYCPASCY